MKTARQGIRVPPLGLATVGVVVITLIGFGLRLSQFGEGLIGDELSSYWVVYGRSLSETLDVVSSTAEITPPLYFILGWSSLELGSAPELIRLPSLVAGTLAIPLTYAVGARLAGRWAGTVAAAVMALSPFMIYYSTEARAYSLMIAFVLGSTLALVTAVRSGAARWWVVYAVCSCAALYSHYTCVFVLAGQALWALVWHRESARALLLANLGILAGFAPWISGYLSDSSSPTTQILSQLQPFTLDYITEAVGAWAVGYPYLRLGVVPGEPALVLTLAGILTAVVGILLRGARRRPRREGGETEGRLRRVPAGVALVLVLLLATPVGEAIYSAMGANLLGARNLNAGWPGLAIAFGALVAAAGAPLMWASAALLISGFGWGAATTLRDDVSRPDLEGVAKQIESQWRPGDVVVDIPVLTPVPLTGLDVYLPQTNPEIRLGLPISDQPFKVGDPEPNVDAQIAQALRQSRGRSMFVVDARPGSSLRGGRGREQSEREERVRLSARLLKRLPPGYEVAETKRFPGFVELTLVRIEHRP